MSKSLGNFITIRDIYKRYLPEVLRFFLVSSHYRSPLDYSDQGLDEAEKGIKRIYAAKAQMEQALNRSKWSETKLPPEIAQELTRHEEEFTAAMDDDLNTAQALGHVFGAMRLAGRLMEDKTMAKSRETAELLRRIMADLAVWSRILGVFGRDSQDFLTNLKACRLARLGIDAVKVDSLVADRQEARKTKDFARSDAIRDELANLGVTVMDTPAGPQWDVA